VLLDRYGPRRVQSALLLVAAAGAALFGASQGFLPLVVARGMIGLGVAAALTAGLKAIILWLPRERVALLNGYMIMLGALGAVTATAPAERLIGWTGWRGLFELLAAATAASAVVIYLVVPEPVGSEGKSATPAGLKTVYADSRFWRLAPLSATCVGSAWALQGLWAAPYRTVDDVIGGVVMTFVDISDRKRHERERGMLSAIVDSSFDAIIGHTLEGTITNWNRAAEDMFGYPAGDIIGRPMSALLPPGRADEAAALSRRIGRGDIVRSFDTVLMRKDETEIAVALTVSPVKDEQGRMVGASTIASDATIRKKMEVHQTLLLHELSHRVKNTLATVQSISAQTLRASGVAPTARAALEGRLIALARAHDILMEQNWGNADLHEIASRVLDAFVGNGGDRVRREGPSVHVTPKVALALAMALQELATNASKYGALSNDAGHVSVSWTVQGKDPPMVSLRWQEAGGPPVQEPSHQGFGSRLIKLSLAEELGGEVDVQYARAGVSCTIDFPLPGGR
jgi:PAS domain S-box-containing protein